MTDFFQFEADFVDSLRCIPMQVRLKLDSCGVKLKLAHWNQFSEQERQQLVLMPCTSIEETSHYRQWLQNLLIAKMGKAADTLPIEDNPPWLDESKLPEQVREQAAACGIILSQANWQKLSPLQRFALIKLSRSGHENRNFYPALVEFNLTKH